MEASHLERDLVAAPVRPRMSSLRMGPPGAWSDQTTQRGLDPVVEAVERHRDRLAPRVPRDPFERGPRTVVRAGLAQGPRCLGGRPGAAPSPGRGRWRGRRSRRSKKAPQSARSIRWVSMGLEESRCVRKVSASHWRSADRGRPFDASSRHEAGPLFREHKRPWGSQAASCSGAALGSSTEKPGYHSRKRGASSPVEHPRPRLQQQVRAPLRLLHLLTLGKPLRRRPG